MSLSSSNIPKPDELTQNNANVPLTHKRCQFFLLATLCKSDIHTIIHNFQNMVPLREAIITLPWRMAIIADYN